MSELPQPIAEPGMELERDILDSRAAGGMLVRGGALRAMSFVAIVGLSVLSAALLTRYLKPGLFGRYTTVMSLVALVAAVTDAGMSSIGTREYAILAPAPRDRLMRDLLGLRVVLTLCGVAIATAFSIASGFDAALVGGTVAAGLGTVAIVYQHTLSIPLSADLRLGTISVLDVVRQALTVAAIVALIAVGSGVLALLAVALVVNLLLIAPTGSLVRGRISLRARLTPRAWPPLLRMTVAFSLATAVGTVYVYAAQILTEVVASPHQAGLFALSFRVFIVAGGIPGLLVSGALPLLARAARDDMDRLAYGLQRIFEMGLIGGVGAALVTIAGARFIVDVVGGPLYGSAVPVLRIQALALIASFLLAGWGYGLLSLHRHRELLVANVLALATSCGLTVWLASTDGARGAAIATVCGESVLALGYLVLLVRARRSLTPSPAVVPKVALCAGAAAVAALVPAMPSVARAVTAAVVYAAVALLTRALPSDLLELNPLRRRQ